MTRKQIEDIQEFLEKILSRSQMFIANHEIHQLKGIVKECLNKNMSTSCSTCIRQDLLLLRDFVYEKLKDFEAKKIKSEKKEIEKFFFPDEDQNETE